MPKRPKGVSGGAHSIEPEFNRVVLKLSRMYTITRVIAGRSRAVRHRHKAGTMRITRKTIGGYKAVAYGSRGITEYFLLTGDTIPLGTEYEA